MLRFNILLYVFKLVERISYSIVFGSLFLMFLYNSLRNLIDFNIPELIQLYFLCFWGLNFIFLQGKNLSLLRDFDLYCLKCLQILAGF